MSSEDGTRRSEGGAMTALEKRCVELLGTGPLTANEIAYELHVAENTAFGILGRLKQAGLVAVDRVVLRGRGMGSGRGKNVYALSPEPKPRGFQRMGS